jgi:signal transduction histidine kinase/ligand-binding sensor domain-containing protein/CheY-like chemotaxis protein/AraC-like DNA-binding protein
MKAQESFSGGYNITYITMNNGLPHNFVDHLYKDSNGFLWVSTGGGGLARYDGYEFLYFNPNTTYCPLKSNFITGVCEDTRQRLWAISEGGTDIIDLNTLQPVIPDDPKNLLRPLLRQPATRIVRDVQGCIWLFADRTLHRITFDEAGKPHTRASMDSLPTNIMLRDVDEDGSMWTGIDGKVYKITQTPEGTLTRQLVSEHLTFIAETVFTDFLPNDNNVWIATDRGLYRYNRNSRALKEYLHNPNDPQSLSQNFLTDLTLTTDHRLLATTLRGVNIYKPATDNFEHLSTADHTHMPLNSNFINCVLVDGERIWLGTESGGINLLTPKRISVTNYRHNKEEAGSLSPNPVNAIYEDDKGILWIGTVEGGLNRKAPGDNRFTHYTVEHDGLAHNSVSALAADRHNRLWVGTWGGGISIVDKTRPQRSLRTITLYPPTAQPLLFIGVLTYDPINNGMWIGANRGLYYYDIATDRLSMPLEGGVAENIFGCIGSIIDREGRLWIGTSEGVYIIHLQERTPDGNFAYRHLAHKLDHPESPLIEKITCCYQASDGTLWLGSNGYGIYRRTVDAQGREQFTAYTTRNGLANNSVRGITGDERGNIWVATNNGLSHLQPTQNRFTNYTEQDGLISAQFYWNATCRTSDGMLYFGSVDGLSAIDSHIPPTLPTVTDIRFTHLRIDDQEILPGNLRYPRDIAVTDNLTLHERDKSFSLEFSALNFEAHGSGVYSYRLLGFDSRWIEVPDDRRFAGYTNLPPGNYTLQVKYTNDQDNSETALRELHIRIVPFFYKTTWFLLACIVMVLLAAWQLYQWRIRSLKQQRARLQRKVEERTRELTEQNLTLKQQNEKIIRQKAQIGRMAHKVQEMTLDKIAFFTNITHEFRTPITLIIGPIERALKLSYNQQVIEQLHFVERNSKYLLSLVNQLMDFRKVESGKFTVNPTEGNLLQFMETLLLPFDRFTAERNIRLRRFFRLPSPVVMFDEDAMHKLITNLLSNAVKFTPDGGTVTLYVAALPSPDNNTQSLYICVSDSGTGIPQDDLTRIFGRFYQSKHQPKFPVHGQTGTGIGLYLCRHIVKMHGGSITARNNRVKGASFRIILPLPKEIAATPPVDNLPQPTVGTPGEEALLPPAKAGINTLLVVEDNADMRSYIRSILRERFRVIEAANGAEALELLLSTQVDFIVSDLMMPVMDGLELSRRVKQNFAISHIPFLMLTAKTSAETRLDSYRMGVDEYLLKPFDETLLLARIDNILDNRRRYQRKFTMDMNIEELHIENTSDDRKFMNHVMDIMKVHYQNPHFDIDDLSDEAGVSRTLLNRKLSNLTGQTTGQFIRNYRLNIARELIVKCGDQGKLNISTIAYDVGFNDPKYFTRCFTKCFGMPPSELQAKEADTGNQKKDS